MSYIFDSQAAIPVEQKIAQLENDVQRFRRACLSDWPRPIDRVNLLDALFALETLKASTS